jgi:uncharacterized protein with HEPN domain
MQIRTAKLLHDCLGASEEILSLTENLTLDDYLSNRVLRLAVERLFEIVGESLNLAIQSDDSIRSSLPEYRRVIGMRNRLIHGYAEVSDIAVWGAVTKNLPQFVVRLTEVMQLAPNLDNLSEEEN